MEINTGTILNIVIAILAVLLIFIPLRYDILRNTKRYRKSKNKTLIESLTKWGWFFFIGCILMIIFNIWKIFFDSKENRDNKNIVVGMTKKQDTLRHLIDSLVIKNIEFSNELKIIESKGDRNKEEIIKSHPKIKYEAKLDLFPSGNKKTNPSFIFNEKKDDATFNIYVQNLGNIEAEQVQDNCLLVYYSNKKEFYQIYQISKIANKSTNIFPETTASSASVAQFTYHLRSASNGRINFSIPSFLYFNLKYLSVSSTKSINKIYKIDNDGISESDPEWYNRIEKDLRIRHLW